MQDTAAEAAKLKLPPLLQAAAADLLDRHQNDARGYSITTKDYEAQSSQHAPIHASFRRRPERSSRTQIIRAIVAQRFDVGIAIGQQTRYAPMRNAGRRVGTRARPKTAFTAIATDLKPSSIVHGAGSAFHIQFDIESQGLRPRLKLLPAHRSLLRFMFPP